MNLAEDMEYEYLIHQVVFGKEPPKTSVENERKLLREFIATIVEFQRHIPPQTLRLMQQFQKTLLEPNTEDVCQRINALVPGDTFAMLIRAQDTVFIIHMPDDKDIFENVHVATFPASFPANVIYGSCGDLKVKSVIFKFY